MTDLRFKITSLQDGMDDIAAAIPGPWTIVINPTEKLGKKEFALNMATARHGMGRFPDGTRFDVRVANVHTSLNDGDPGGEPPVPHTMVDRGLHLDIRIDDDGGSGSNSALILTRMTAGPPIDFVIPANIKAAYGLKTSAAGAKDPDTNRPTEPQVPITRAPQAGGTQMVAPFHPKHTFG